MQANWLERTELLIQKSGLEKLRNTHVLIVGLGGVGSFAAEFIARAGVGKMTIVDGDSVDSSNINRQLPALHSTIGKSKVEVMKDRLSDINPLLDLQVINEFIQPERASALIDEVNPDYTMDCIDSLKPKVWLIVACKKCNVPIISAMGAGGKIDPAQVRMSDISKTYNCKLAFAVRKRLGRDYQIKQGVKAVYSVEAPNPKSLKMVEGSEFKKSFYGTVSFIPAAFGLHAAAAVISDLLAN